MPARQLVDLFSDSEVLLSDPADERFEFRIDLDPVDAVDLYLVDRFRDLFRGAQGEDPRQHEDENGDP